MTNARWSLILLAAFFAAFPGEARADVYSIITNPGEDCSTQMNIGWQADRGDTNCTVIYTVATDASWSQARTAKGTSKWCEIFDGINSKTPAGVDWKEEAKFWDYGASLTELTPNTRYRYKVESGAGNPGETNRVNGRGKTAVHYFKTAGASDFSFVWISDIHAYTPIPNRVKNANAVLEAAIKIDPRVDFVFSTGDVVAWGASYSFWRYLYDQPFAKNYMFANVIGNHDWMARGGDGSSDYFCIANNNPPNGYAGQEGVCYWFIYGDVLFLMFNNELMKKSAEAEETAKTWASHVIEKQQGTFKRIIIAEHYQWFDGRNGKASWYDHWKDFCDKYNVTLALSGNNHVYARSRPLRGGKVVPTGQGTVYMQAPSSDGERGVEAGEVTANGDKLAFTYSSHEHSNDKEVKTIACVLVHVTPAAITTKLVYLDEKRAVRVADEVEF